MTTEVCEDHMVAVWRQEDSSCLGYPELTPLLEPSVLLKMSDDGARAAGMGRDEKHQVGNGAGVGGESGLIISQIWGQVRKDERKS